MNLRFRHPAGKQAMPTAILPLFQCDREWVAARVLMQRRGGTFNNQYNNRTPITFTVPTGTQFVQLGPCRIDVRRRQSHDCACCRGGHHGPRQRREWWTRFVRWSRIIFCAGCGEFCVTTHVFDFNKQHNASVTFSEAGTQFGCADKVPLGFAAPREGLAVMSRQG